MDTRFVQAHKEARWALGLTLLYLAVWLVAAYLSGVAPGFTGFPRWFEMACILTPLLFIGLCWAMVKFIYRDIPLEDDDAAEVILPLVAYLVVVFGISVYAMRKRSTGTFLNEYFLGSRSMGGIVLAMTLTATYISASSFIGGPGAAYKYGLGWVLLAMIQLPAVWLSLGILGKKFAILARRYNAVTLNDMLFARYQSRLLVWLASLSLLVAFVGAMTVQFIGGARLLETAAGIPYETGLLIFGISIALYTAFGGFRASVLNDTMQGLVMLIGTVVLLIGVVHAAGGK